jgi:hypothetical protein
MDSSDERLWDIVDKAASTSFLSAEELAYAEESLKSPIPVNRANACEAILRCSRAQAQREAAVRTLEELCLNSAEQDYVMTLLIALMYARTAVFSNSMGMKLFVMRLGHSSKYYFRANATDSVWVLAEAGDRDAVQLLRLLANDEDERVRKNASYYLRKLGE